MQLMLLVWAFLCAAGAAAALLPTMAFFVFLSAVAKHEREALRGALVSLVVAMLLWGLVWTIPVPRLMTALERFF